MFSGLYHTSLYFWILNAASSENGPNYNLYMPCSLMEYSNNGHCIKNEYSLLCRKGFPMEWLRKSNTDILNLTIVGWPGECLNAGRLQQFFPALQRLEIIDCLHIRFFKGHFDENSKINTLVMSGLTSLLEVPPELVTQMSNLVEADLRNNALRHMRSRFLKSPPRLERVLLSNNQWDCSDGGLDWLAMEKDNDTVKIKIVDYFQLICHQQLYKGKPLHKVMNIKRTVHQTCPQPCICAMTHVVWDRDGGVVPLITVDCSYRNLEELPVSLPPSTTTLRLEGNKINNIKNLLQNPHYKKLVDLYLDNNSLSTVKELEVSEWFTSFRVLSLRGNFLKQIPVFAFDKAFQSNNNIMHVFLGNNPWRCDCHYAPRFQGLLRKYKRVIRDLPDIKCSKSSDKKISMHEISTIVLGNVCSKNDTNLLLSPVNIANVVLALLILLILAKFTYDWHSFKRTGKLPWLSTVLP